MPKITVEDRPYEFQGSHHTSREIATYVVCECGWEKRVFTRWDDKTEPRMSILEHRMDHAEGQVLMPNGTMTTDLTELAREEAEALGYDVD